MKKIWYLILLFLIIPIKVNASTLLVSEDRKPIVGSTFVIDASIDYGTNKIMTAHYVITYDNACFSLASTSWPQGSVSMRNESGMLYIDKEATTPLWQPGTFAIFTFRVDRKCTSAFEIKDNGGATNQKGESIFQTFASLTISTEESSNNNQIEGLSIVNQSFNSTFSKNEHNYSASVDAETNEVEIVVNKGDTKQTISSNGEVKEDDDKKKAHIRYNLKPGLNRISIKVTAEDGSSNNYTIMVTKASNESKEADLKRLSVSNTNIKYVEGKDTYQAKVNSEVENIFITASTVDPYAELTGTGTKKLIDGENKFTIRVKSSTGAEKTYTIIITRGRDIENPNTSNKIKSLRINGDLIKDLSKNFIMGVGTSVTSLKLDIELESETATYSVEGNKNLENGLNTIIITVSDDNVDSSLYYIRVYKELEGINIIKTLDGLNNLPANVIVKSHITDKHLISKDVINLVQANTKEIYYNVVDNKEGLLYRIMINRNIKEKEEIDASIVVNKKEPLTYESKIRKDIKVLLFLDTEEFSDGEVIKIYSYNNENNYRYVDSVSLKDGYVEFTSDGSDYYVFTKQTLVDEDNGIIKLLKQFQDYIIFGIALVVIIIFLLVISKMKKRKKKMVEK